MMMNRSGMREIQAKKDRPNLGAEKAVRIPLAMASAILVSVLFTGETPEWIGTPTLFYQTGTGLSPGAQLRTIK